MPMNTPIDLLNDGQQTSWWQQPQFRRIAGNALSDLGSGLTRGSSASQVFSQAGQRQEALGPMRAEEQARQEGIQAQQEQMNETVRWMQGNTPQAYAQLQGGLPMENAFALAQQEFQASNAPPPERDIIEAADGFQYYVGGGLAPERVVPEAAAPIDEPNTRPMTPEQRALYGIPESDTRPYQLTDGKASVIGGGGQTINVSTGASDKFRAEFDKRDAQMFADLIDNGYKAQTSLIKIGQLENLLGQVDTGAGAVFKQMAGNLGIASEGLNEIQAAQAIINQLVPAQRPVGSGPMSDADLELFKQSMPRLINQPGGNEKIIRTMKGIAEYTQAQGAIANKVASGELTPAQGREALMSLPNPLDTAAPAAGNQTPNVGDIVDNYVFLGGDPSQQSSWRSQ